MSELNQKSPALQAAVAAAQEKLKQSQHAAQNPVTKAVKQPTAPIPARATKVASSDEMVFFCRIPGSAFIDKEARKHFFYHGELRTSSPELIAELLQVADIEGSPIYTDRPVVTASDSKPGEEVLKRAVEVADDLAKAQQAILSR